MHRSLPTGRERLGHPLRDPMKDPESLYGSEKPKDQLPWTPFAPNVSSSVYSLILDDVADLKRLEGSNIPTL